MGPKSGQEVDIIVEEASKRPVAIEVKVSPVVRDDDARNLHWLRDLLGDRFVAGLVVHAGATAYRRQDGLYVLPLAGLA